MYSIVMLTAMSAGADVTPAPAPVVVAPVASGCCGSIPAGCYGSCTGSYYYRASCHGSCHGHVARGFLGARSCHGCGGYSCSGFNCFSSGYSSCHGSCYGSYIASYGSCSGCSGTFSYGSTWGPPIGMPPYTLHGYNTGLPGYGPGTPVVVGNYTDPNAVWGAYPNRPPVMTIPVAPPAIPKSGSDGGMGANLKFTVPADAKLFVDGAAVAGTGTERTFFTPPLAAGQKFFYDVKAELVVDGKTVTEEKRVIVEAGASVTESFPKLVAAATNATTVAGK